MLQQMIQCQGMVPQAIVQTKFDAHPMHVPREYFQIGFLSSQSSHHGKFGDKAWEITLLGIMLFDGGRSTLLRRRLVWFSEASSLL